MITFFELKKLLDEGCTCALTDGERVVTSRERGVRPLVELIASGADYNGWHAADKIVGKAAALLYAKLGVAELYAQTLSVGGLGVCRRFRIAAEYGALTPEIINRKGDGACPMELAVADADDPTAAYEKICAALERLRREATESPQ